MGLLQNGIELSIAGQSRAAWHAVPSCQNFSGGRQDGGVPTFTASASRRPCPAARTAARHGIARLNLRSTGCRHPIWHVPIACPVSVYLIAYRGSAAPTGEEM